jgi:acetoin utilization protein AcuB
MAEEAWPEGIRVGEIMTRPAVTFRQEMLVAAAATAMKARKIRHAPVVDGKSRVVGIVTDRDLRQVILEPGIREAVPGVSQVLKTLAVKDVMTWGVITVSPETSLRQAAHLMRANKIGAVPVVAHDRAVGMLTATDVLRILIQILDEGVTSKPGRWGAEG